MFVALVVEPCGYMGSWACVSELEKGGAAVEGLDFEPVDQGVLGSFALIDEWFEQY